MLNSVKKAQSIVGSNNDGGRPENDFYPTPPVRTLGLLKVESFVGDLWEPACGDGSMSKVLESEGYQVVSTDLQPRGYGVQGDFFFLWVASCAEHCHKSAFQVGSRVCRSCACAWMR